MLHLPKDAAQPAARSDLYTDLSLTSALHLVVTPGPILQELQAERLEQTVQTHHDAQHQLTAVRREQTIASPLQTTALPLH